MTTEFPGAIDTFVDPTASDPMNSPSHSGQHTNINDAVLAIEEVIGTTAAPKLAPMFISTAGHPTTGIWSTGTSIIDSNGITWNCTAGGTPGTWAASGGGSSVTSPDGTINVTDGNEIDVHGMDYSAPDIAFFSDGIDDPAVGLYTDEADGSILLSPAGGAVTVYSGSGSPVGVKVPGAIGALWVDITTPALWQGTGTDNDTQWEQIDASGITALTGDVTATGPGSSVATLQDSANVQAIIVENTPGPADWYNVVTQGGADPTGTVDATAIINTALTNAGAGGVVYLPDGQYKTTSTIIIPTGVTLMGASRTLGIPTGNYGIGSLPLQGAILVPTSAVTGSVVYLQSNASTQYGNQQLKNITVNGASLPASVNGIQADAVGGVTLRDVTVWGVTGDGLHCAPVSGTGFVPPDFWDVAFCKFSANAGNGVSLNGLADSWFTDCEATGNTGCGWIIINGGNTKFIGCKGESNTLQGWNFTANASFTAQVSWTNCTSQFNTEDGFYLTGAGTCTLRFSNCSASNDGSNGTSSGLRSSSFAGTIMIDNWVGVAASYPQYGLSFTSVGAVFVNSGLVNGATAPIFNGGGNGTYVIGSVGTGSIAAGITPVQSLNVTGQAFGYLGWTVDPAVVASNVPPGTGRVYLVRFRCVESGTIGHFNYYVVTAGATLTSGQNVIGLYDTGQTTAGLATLLSTSADQSANWVTSGVELETPLSTPTAIVAGEDYFFAVLSVGTTPPAFARGSSYNLMVNQGLSGLGLRTAFYATGSQMALPATIAAANLDVSGATNPPVFCAVATK